YCRLKAAWLRETIISRFFFQAEAGIRVLYVTGVQTCALPICSASSHNEQAFYAAPVVAACRTASDFRADKITRRCRTHRRRLVRSEERRVGKERRARRSGGP